MLTVRVAGVAMHLGFLLERALRANDWREREAALVERVRHVAQRQRDVGLPDVGGG